MKVILLITSNRGTPFFSWFPPISLFGISTFFLLDAGFHVQINFSKTVDGSVGAKTPAGTAGQVYPARALALMRLTARPRKTKRLARKSLPTLVLNVIKCEAVLDSTCVTFVRWIFYIQINFSKTVDGSVGTKTPAGAAGQVRPRRSVALMRLTARLRKAKRLERKWLPPLKTKKEDKLDLSNLSSIWEEITPNEQLQINNLMLIIKLIIKFHRIGYETRTVLI